MQRLHGPPQGLNRAPAPARIGRRATVLVRNIAEAERAVATGNGSGASALPAIMGKVRSICGKSTTADLTAKDAYNAVAYTTRDELIDRFNKTHAYWAVSTICAIADAI